MRNKISVLVLLLCVCCFTACGSPKGEAGEDDKVIKEDKLTILTTNFAEYDWVKNILGENPGDCQVSMLLDQGVDMHSYQPTAEDILRISSTDIFIYVGGESDAWVTDALENVKDNQIIVVNLLEALGDSAKEEETVEGMQPEADQEDDQDEDRDKDHDRPERDEHVWLSLRNAAVLTEKISRVLAEADPDHSSVYKENTSAYVKRLKALDKEYADAVSAAKVKTLLFGDRFPFRYLTDDYGQDYYAAFPGCSSETEASFETITFLAGKMDELSLHAVLTIEGTDHRIAETIVSNTGTKDQKILSLNSMQAVSSEDMEEGAEYIKIMEDNLTVLKEALQ
ncbi:MAG: zinc ABC transporter substrate-binding protein [Eubacterium sp.]|nr:zinc ABC transporter substrate-binding protein [Eubacterium sp.]